jgi:hypothetical protein
VAQWLGRNLERTQVLRGPHKDSKTRTIRTSGNISPVPKRKKAILGFGVRVTIKVRFRVLRLRERENRILNGNQLLGPHKDSKTNVCV